MSHEREFDTEQPTYREQGVYISVLVFLPHTI